MDETANVIAKAGWFSRPEAISTHAWGLPRRRKPIGGSQRHAFLGFDKENRALRGKIPV
jgi:hypothetical protein